MDFQNFFLNMKIKLTKKKTISEYIDILRKNYPYLKDQYKINYFGIFGSFVRNEQKENSDLDLLISFEKTPTLFQFIRLEQYLSNLLKIKVDLVMKDSLKPIIGKYILNEVVEI